MPPRVFHHRFFFAEYYVDPYGLRFALRNIVNECCQNVSSPRPSPDLPNALFIYCDDHDISRRRVLADDKISQMEPEVIGLALDMILDYQGVQELEKGEQ
jgi:hypothetical protein